MSEKDSYARLIYELQVICLKTSPHLLLSDNLTFDFHTLPLTTCEIADKTATKVMKRYPNDASTIPTSRTSPNSFNFIAGVVPMPPFVFTKYFI